MAFTTTDQHESGMGANLVVGDKARPLRGMKDIGTYLGVSENTVRKYIRDENLPVGRVGGGIVSDEALIDAWRIARIG